MHAAWMGSSSCSSRDSLVLAVEDTGTRGHGDRVPWSRVSPTGVRINHTSFFQGRAVAMARRPLSESYQSVCSSSSDQRTVGVEDEEDGAPIFSLSRSSVDVVMATGPPHKRDPAWTTMDMRRSSSTNTHPEGHLVALKQLPPHMWQHMNVSNSHHMPPTAQTLDVNTSPVLSERWIANVHRWSQCSSSTHSRSSTPDTIVGRDGTPHHCSLPQETPFSAAPDSLVSSPMSPSTNPASLPSPLQTPTLRPEVLLTSSPLILSPGQQDFFSPASPPLVSPHQASASPPLMSNSPSLQLTSTEDDSFLDNNHFTFPSPILSSTSLADTSDNRSLADADADAAAPHPPERSEIEESAGKLLENSCDLMPNSPVNKKESLTSDSYGELAWEPARSWWMIQSSRSPLVCSVSDSQLRRWCRCNMNTKESISKAPKGDEFREEGTMTSRPDLVDAEVQTMTPAGSLWGLRKIVSTSNMGSNSFLGSPPGSRLNLKSSVGSNSNLVSPSSSMFPIGSEEEEEKHEEEQTEETLQHPERRRSCLKTQGEEKEDMRRGSMKQVQWDEDGMTWDIHGASPDPQELSDAIQKHLEVLSSNQTVKRASTKKKAPKPPIKSNVDESPDHKNPSGVNREAAEPKREQSPDGGRKMDKGGGAKEEGEPETDPRLSRSESDARSEEPEGSSPPRSPSQGSAQNRKRSVIRSLRRPRWCLGSRKIDD